MEILSAAQAATFVTDITADITTNMPGVLVVLGAAAGIAVAFGLLRFGLAKLTHSWKS